ncbi:hypothetical protein CcI49_37070 [Frankia sp. CcI49]|nr:hypothetical protein CcI49_37070 [Frankia sp. CcI49]
MSTGSPSGGTRGPNAGAAAMSARGDVCIPAGVALSRLQAPSRPGDDGDRRVGHRPVLGPRDGDDALRCFRELASAAFAASAPSGSPGPT